VPDEIFKVLVDYEIKEQKEELGQQNRQTLKGTLLSFKMCFSCFNST
jgi:hypothetical protein